MWVMWVVKDLVSYNKTVRQERKLSPWPDLRYRNRADISDVLWRPLTGDTGNQSAGSPQYNWSVMLRLSGIYFLLFLTISSQISPSEAVNLYYQPFSSPLARVLAVSAATKNGNNLHSYWDKGGSEKYNIRPWGSSWCQKLKHML